GLLPDETHFLNALKESVEAGETPAEELLRRFDEDWGGDFAGLYRDCSY
ncbi:MAG: glutamate--cysteine ligase, partial [Pseudomonadota bacterium]